MRYTSTRGGISHVNFEETVLSGFAKDGGMFLPESLPKVSKSQLLQFSKLKYTDLCLELCSLFIDESEIPKSELKKVVEESFVNFPENVVPVTPIDKNLYVAELFHGPTYAFKDLALQFVGNVCNYFLMKRNKRIVILVATSGDTGSAAIHGIRGKSNAEIFVLYPKGRISNFQELQMTTVLDDNVHVLCVDNSTSDDLDVICKNCFDDLEFNEKHNLCSINSINWARIMVQTVHYFHAYLRSREYLIKENKIANADDYWPSVVVSVPTGAFGNGCAGIMCKMMGLPIEKLVIATNENDILTRYFTTGVFQKGSVVPTISPSIDIQVPYNFERFMYWLSNNNGNQVKEWMNKFKQDGVLDLGPDLFAKSHEWVRASSVNTEEVIQVIKHYYEKDKYLLDPHSAVGVKAVQKLKQQKVFDESTPLICLATAHACKFADTIQQAIGITPAPLRQESILTDTNIKTKFTLLTKETAEEPLRQMIHEAFFKK